MVIDGIPVNEEERTKAELYYMDQQQVYLKSNNTVLFERRTLSDHT